jgi:small subunit ribosomal protein S26e
MVEAAAVSDLAAATIYDQFVLPKIYVKTSYCVSCAIHAHIVRVRSVEGRRVRVSPRFQREKSAATPAVAAA